MVVWQLKPGVKVLGKASGNGSRPAAAPAGESVERPEHRCSRIPCTDSRRKNNSFECIAYLLLLPVVNRDRRAAAQKNNEPEGPDVAIGTSPEPRGGRPIVWLRDDPGIERRLA